MDFSRSNLRHVCPQLVEVATRFLRKNYTDPCNGVASSTSEGDIFIYLCSAQLTSFEIDLISKEINCAEQEYMNMSPSLIELATPLDPYKTLFTST